MSTSDISIWNTYVKKLDFAFQPIINFHTGSLLGYEALLRNYEAIGFATPSEVFDCLFENNLLFKIDLQLRNKAFLMFKKIRGFEQLKLFYNIDNRVLSMPDFQQGLTCSILEEMNLKQSNICFELSEKHEICPLPDFLKILKSYKEQLYTIAIDDFGTGYSGYQMLYLTEPDYIKIDRFFIQDIDVNTRKRAIAISMINIAHVLGIKIIAEGIETRKEFELCKEIGADFAQGYFIQSPTCDYERAGELSPLSLEVIRVNRRNNHNDYRHVLSQLEHLNPIIVPQNQMKDIFEIFRKNKTHSFLPVVNHSFEPLGVIKESDLKDFVYSPYGKDLLMNPISHNRVNGFIQKIPTVEYNTRIEKILEIFSQNKNSECVIITENGKYIGFLSAHALLTALNTKNLSYARNQNPLTKLPGNYPITEYVHDVIELKSGSFTFIYFDFDNFKPFNDTFGFRLGDRAIVMFSEILQKFNQTSPCFLGHIGGDDFFVGLNDMNDKNTIDAIVQNLQEKFNRTTRILFPEEIRKNGSYQSENREGITTRFNLLSVSAAIISFTLPLPTLNSEIIFQSMAKLKKKAKNSLLKRAHYELSNINESYITSLQDSVTS